MEKIWHKFGNLEKNGKNLEMLKHFGNLKIGNEELDNRFYISKLLPWYTTKVCQLSIDKY